MKKLAVLAATLVLGTGVANAAEEMRCSHQLPPQHHIAKVIDQWAAEVESLSGGEIDVQVFGASSLVEAKENIASVAKGNIECAFSINPQWGKTLPLMNVTLKPFAVTDLKTLAAWPGSEAADFLEEKLLGKGVRNVVWLFTTRMSAMTSKGHGLINPDDFKGVKIRGLNPVADAGLVAMGAAPSAMSGSKVYQALSTGVIDAGMTDVSAAYSRKYYEVQDHVTVTPLFSVFFHGYVNPAWYDKLDDKAKKALAEAGAKAAEWAVAASEEAAADAPAQLAEHGMKVHMQTEAEMAAWKAVMVPAFDKSFGDATGEDGVKLLELVAKIGN
ncbi:TRAP transporter substrate-binding protein DctP [Oceanibacterium hippocampi]|uniref:C4-dicarboxylate-binding periplasmic protein n=1 Tax=Oceanibacterium hippocampi TaxID=745714 RepID=A0A1Y5S8G1_9PROT|nr:TRAP transporter substrate-binding protein DctP [Oceanibacterium hippocampi]SLN32447.1 C4-dicarboxylate-binding periplasmic protein precursor [Oceanibacterium hippocampi]